jgi:hypothetical protein
MATVSLIDPYSQQAEEIARRKRMAQALQEQGSQVLEMPTTPGVLISPYAGLGKLLQSGIGAYKEKQAREDYAKLQNEYRTNYNNQFGDLARAISAPAVEGVIGQEATKDIPGWTRPLGLDTSGTEMFEDVAPVQGKPAIPARPALPAGYISPKTLQGIDIPEVKQLAMAKYLAQFEPKQVTLSDNQRLLERIGSGDFKEVVGPATTAAKKLNPEWKEDSRQINGKTVAGWINLNAETPASTFVAGGKPEKGKEITPHWVIGQKDVNGKTQYGWYDLNSADKDASFKAGANPPAGEKSNWKEVTRDNKVFYEDFNIADATQRQAGAIAKEAVKTPPHYSEIENNGRVVIVDMSLPAKDRLANAQDKGPIRNNLEKITTTDANGREVTRYVDKGLLATMGDIPAPYKGFMSDLADAGQLPANWQNIPQIAGLVRENLINKAGGITQADLARLKVNIAEAASRLAYEGVPGFNPKDLTPQLPNFTTLSGGASAAAPAALKITTRAEIAEAAKRANKSIEEVTRDAVAKGYKVQ